MIFKFILSIFYLGISLKIYSQTIFFVDASKENNLGDGTSWNTAKRDLQNAINNASFGDEIWVKAGVYKPTENPLGTLDPVYERGKTFLLKDGVKLFGGFSGNETNLNQRNCKIYITNLSGDIGVINDKSDNVFHILLSINNSNATLLDGFNIENANADGIAYVTLNSINISRRGGGGMIIINSNISINNCKIINNLSFGGGGILSLNSNPIISNCIFNKNSGGNNSSGGIFNELSNPTIINCIFNENEAGTCGAIYNFNSSPIISNTVFTKNRASIFNGGAIYNTGSSNPSIYNCTFYGNSAHTGGAIYYSDDLSGGEINNCIFWNNESYRTNNYRHDIYSNNRTATQVKLSKSIMKDYKEGYTININFLNTPIIDDPVFLNIIDLDGADNTWGTSDDGLNISCDSPAKDAGIVNDILLDIVKNERINYPDIGAYEANNINLEKDDIPLVYTTATLNQLPIIINYSNCFNQICSIDGRSPYNISGNVTAKIWVENDITNSLVKRHYEINPLENSLNASGRITLYFTHTDFDEFNLINNTKLPSDNYDLLGKSNSLTP